MTTMAPVVFLVDVDDTLLENDRIQDDLRNHLEREYGRECRDRYWAIQEQLMQELGYRDYLGALQRYRMEHPTDVRLLAMSSYLVDYPFANRLYPGALDVLEKFRAWGPTVILSDGDVVFQPRKVERSGIREAVEGHVLIYIHKEEALDDVQRMCCNFSWTRTDSLEGDPQWPSDQQFSNGDNPSPRSFFVRYGGIFGTRCLTGMSRNSWRSAVWKRTIPPYGAGSSVMLPNSTNGCDAISNRPTSRGESTRHT